MLCELQSSSGEVLGLMVLVTMVFLQTYQGGERARENIYNKSIGVRSGDFWIAFSLSACWVWVGN